ncbi:PRD domain-containing protein, partial [Erysipelatoclostridium ramosum]
IYQESSERFVDLQTLKDIFPNLNVQLIHDILHDIFKKHSCYINDFGYTNLTLHLAVLLDRMQSGNTIEHSQTKQPALSDITRSV